MRHLLVFATLSSLVACGADPSIELELPLSAYVTPGSPEEAAVLGVVNDPQVTRSTLDDDVRLDARAARGIASHRAGDDGTYGNADDNPFDDIDELDRVSYVGRSALDKLLAYARQNGYFDGDPTNPADEQAAALAFVNDPATTFELLDDDVGLDARAARRIVAHRDGADATFGTADDDLFDSIAELDAIPYVGTTALARIRDWALSHGYGTGGRAEAIFSPRLYAASHNVRVAQAITAAAHSVDIAMYSFSDEGIYDAIEAAVERGVAARFIFETANADRKKTGAALESSRSARLENMGVNVRWVNKIMHHKFAIIDGPRDVGERAGSATLISGSANWSYGAATRYDENTLFLSGYPTLTLAMQREFNHMWNNSRDFVWDASLPYELSTFPINDLPADDTVGAVFTSDNFSVSNDTFRIISGRNTVADALVAAIAGATDSIWVASGHLRSRPVAEALMAKRAEDASVDIRVYLDGQEYISDWYHNQQLADRAECLQEAGSSASKQRKCYDKGFYYGYQISNTGIDVRYKYYSYRWHYSYAVQMHHKYLIIDGDELWTGSYNLSDNAEHNTFENMMLFRGDAVATLVDAYEDNFRAIWETSRGDDTYADLINEIENDATIPLVFTPMALGWGEVTSLKAAIRANCPDINSEDFRSEPDKHRTCDAQR